MKFDKVIFVGEDNTCRSPMAETIFRYIMKNDYPCEIMSRGLVVLFPEPYNPKIERILKEHGMKMQEKSAAQLEPEDLDGNVLILTMTFTEKLKIIEDFGFEGSVYTLKEYVGNNDELLDPYGEEMDIYEACFEDMYDVMKEVKLKFVLDGIKKEEENDK